MEGYGLLDRWLHRMAFAARAPQLGLADLEARLWRRELAAIAPEPPIFVTALPRAGTTVLIGILANTATIATHRYRDMPFLACPFLWDLLARRFRRRDVPRERAHQDGIMISLESPEAFEEMLWRLYFPGRYRSPTIAPWADCRHPEFADFFRSHMRKIVALRARAKPTARRYASKNNLNTCRMPVLLDTFAGAHVVMPFRSPLQHAASLLRQHLRFTELHRTDAFASRYMLGIGHYDFGAHLKPIDFAGWFRDRSPGEACKLRFWLEYWIHTYEHALALGDHPRFLLLSFEAFSGGADLSPLARSLGIDPANLAEQAGVRRPVGLHEVPTDDIEEALVRRARRVHTELMGRCVLRNTHAHH